MAARGSGVSPSTRRSHRDRIRVSRKNTPCGPAPVRSPPGVQMQNDDPSTRVTSPPPVLVGSVSGVQAPMSVVLWSSPRPPGRCAPVGGAEYRACGRSTLRAGSRTTQSVVLPMEVPPTPVLAGHAGPLPSQEHAHGADLGNDRQQAAAGGVRLLAPAGEP